MTSKTKKILIIGGSILGGLTLTATLLFLKLKKLIEYNLKVSRLEIEKVSLNDFRLKIFMRFTNPADLTIVLARQEYEVFLNGIYITKLKSNVEQVVKPKSVSELNVNLNLDPVLVFQKLAHMQKPLSLITNLKSQKLKLVTKLSVKVGFFTIPISIPYESTIGTFGK